MGLASLDTFLGVPGGEGWGVGPFPLARDSPVKPTIPKEKSEGKKILTNQLFLYESAEDKNQMNYALRGNV